jgi:spore germination cell wall hydrolase CwlJ-like protein
VPQPRRALADLIVDHAATATSSPEQHCLASAIYFEARGESIEGQLAVAEVVLNRTRSGRYPATICAVVRQPAQFSFVRRGVIPRADQDCDHWRRAIAIARIAQAGATRLLPENVLWYHANYVSPGWGRRLERNRRIGAHIFYS